MNFLKGMGVALVTPFDKDYKIDFKALENLIDFQIESGTDYLVVNGTTSENSTLSKEEKKEITKHIINYTNKRIPLVLGVGGNNTAVICEEVEKVNPSDFSAILSVCPYYNKPSQEGLYQHFIKIASRSTLPIILYNVPSRTVVSLELETILRLQKNTSKIIGIKEASGDLEFGKKLIGSVSSNFLVLSGDDFTAAELILLGGHGVISVIGNAYPKEYKKLITLAKNSKENEVESLNSIFNRIYNLLFQEGNPVGIKALLHHLNYCENELRLPLVKATSTLYIEIEKEAKLIASSIR